MLPLTCLGCATSTLKYTGWLLRLVNGPAYYLTTFTCNHLHHISNGKFFFTFRHITTFFATNLLFNIELMLDMAFQKQNGKGIGCDMIPYRHTCALCPYEDHQCGNTSEFRGMLR